MCKRIRILVGYSTAVPGKSIAMHRSHSHTHSRNVTLERKTHRHRASPYERAGYSYHDSYVIIAYYAAEPHAHDRKLPKLARRPRARLRLCPVDDVYVYLLSRFFASSVYGINFAPRGPRRDRERRTAPPPACAARCRGRRRQGTRSQTTDSTAAVRDGLLHTVRNPPCTVPSLK